MSVINLKPKSLPLCHRNLPLFREVLGVKSGCILYVHRSTAISQILSVFKFFTGFTNHKPENIFFPI